MSGRPKALPPSGGGTDSYGVLEYRPSLSWKIELLILVTALNFIMGAGTLLTGFPCPERVMRWQLLIPGTIAGCALYEPSRRLVEWLGRPL